MSGVIHWGTCDWCHKPVIEQFHPNFVGVSPLHSICMDVCRAYSRHGINPLALNPLDAGRVKTLEAEVDTLTQTVNALKAIIQQPVNYRDGVGNTPLMAVAKLGLSSEASLLISKGVDVNLVNFAGESALKLATRYDHLQIALILIKAGADPYDITAFVSPVVLAAEKGMYDVVEASFQSNPTIPRYIFSKLAKMAEDDAILQSILKKYSVL